MSFTIQTTREELSLIENILMFLATRPEGDQPLLLQQEKQLCAQFAQKMIITEALTCANIATRQGI